MSTGKYLATGIWPGQKAAILNKAGMPEWQNDYEALVLVSSPSDFQECSTCTPTPRSKVQELDRKRMYEARSAVRPKENG
ncbi:hypothetical protein RRG08_053472 [Elysia crispata]|uniref:Uncharacterized protein n=1 Tax=Elysia crispata TaxID=231223 RepID=A0AAE1A0C9_9GAST|nr:hypothetical protein RRG08_053472 [Elysia crispata]